MADADLSDPNVSNPPSSGGFIGQICAYFRDFLDTDFRRQRMPKRSIGLKDAKGLLEAPRRGTASTAPHGKALGNLGVRWELVLAGRYRDIRLTSETFVTRRFGGSAIFSPPPPRTAVSPCPTAPRRASKAGSALPARSPREPATQAREIVC
jgi:hypothetical protein